MSFTPDPPPPMLLTFNAIPINIRTPGQYLEFDNSNAIQGSPAQPNKILVIGQRLNTGAVAAATPTRIYGPSDAEASFGRASQLAIMLTALKAANNATECWAVALDDAGGGVAANAALLFTGSPVQAGNLYLYIGGYRVVVPLAAGATASAIATAVVAVLNHAAISRYHGCTASVDGGTNTQVDLVYKHKGESGNLLDVRINYGFGEALPNGLALAITGFSGGTTNPDITVAIAAIAGSTFASIVNPYIDATNLTALETELGLRWGPMVQREGQAFSAVPGSVGTMSTLGASRNCPQECIIGAGKSPTAPWIVASVVAGVEATEPDPARPRQAMPLPGILPPAAADRLGFDDTENLLNSGIATLTDDTFGHVSIQRLITTYQVDINDFPDVSYLDIETMRTLSYMRYTVRARIAIRFPRHKLADDGTLFAPGQFVATPSLITMEILHLAREWEANGLLEDFDQFQADLIVVRDGTDRNRVNALLPPNIVNQFRVFAGSVQFIL
jgi:phage tail sheath gpL-like